MPNPRYRKGTRAEYIVRDALRSRGWVVMRSFASIGPFDLLAVKRLRTPILVSVKADGHVPREAYLRPPERDALLTASADAGAHPIAAHYAAGEVTFTHLLGASWSP